MSDTEHLITPKGRRPSCGWKVTGLGGSVEVTVPGTPALCHAVLQEDGNWGLVRDRGGDVVVRCGSCGYRLDGLLLSG